MNSANNDRERVRAMRELAQWYHSLGANLAPLGFDKRPVATGVWLGRVKHFPWKDWQTVQQTDRLWTQIRGEAYWGEVGGVAVVCGFGGWINIDIDSRAKDDPSQPPVPRSVAEQFLEALGLPKTYPWLVATPTGGWHIFLRVKTLNIELGKLDQLMASAPAVDHVELRWIGHYVALPGSNHPNGGVYEWAGERPSDAPLWIEGDTLLTAYHALTEPKPVKPATPASNSRSSASSTGTPYGRAALEREVAIVRSASQGSRNATLYNSALKMGSLVGAGELSASEVESSLLSAALAIGLTEGEALTAISSGMGNGEKKPRSVPPPMEAGHLNEWIPDLFATDVPDDFEDGQIIVTGTISKSDIDRDLLKYRAEDGGILDCWRDLYADEWLFAVGHELWYRRLPTHWQRDEEQGIHRQIHDLIDLMNETGRTALENLGPDLGKDDLFKTERAIYKTYINATKRSSSRVNSVSTMAQAQRATAADSLDQGNLLNLQNGTLDLNALALRPHDPTDKLSYVLSYNYDPRSTAPRWEQFCQEVLVHEMTDTAGNWRPDHDLIELLQEAIGYSLTNDVRHEAMFWLSGKPNSGKSTISHILRLLLGNMALGVDFDKLGTQGDYTLAEVPGKRVLYSGESRKGQSFAESTIRELVSGDTMTSARKYGHPFQFRSQAKIWWMMNDQPIIRDTSGGIWRRLQLIPFHRTFDKTSRDVNLLEKLSAELPGILNWALVGLHRLQVRGRFPEPQAVQDALLEYQRESNPVQQWIDECAISPNDQGLYLGLTGEVLWTPAKECFASYSQWATQNGRQTMNSTTFGKELAKLRDRRRTNKENLYQIGINFDASPRSRPNYNGHWADNNLAGM